MNVLKYLITYKENGQVHQRQAYAFDISPYIKNWIIRDRNITVLSYHEIGGVL